MERFEAELTIRRTRYANDDSGWAVVEALDASGKTTVLVGPLVHLEERERVHVTGDWVADPRYGPQVKVTEARPLPPADRSACVAYLRRVRHVGAKRAERLVDLHGSETVLERIDADPRAAFELIGLSSGRVAEAVESWNELRVLRRLHLMLAPHGLAYLAPRLSEEFGSRAAEVIIEDPYSLTSVFGVGFLVADRIAATAAAAAPGRSETSPEEREGRRSRAGVLHVLAENERAGSTCMPRAALTCAAGELLGDDPRPELIEAMLAAGDLVQEDGFLYRRATAELEAELAQRVAARLARPDGAAPGPPAPAKTGTGTGTSTGTGTDTDTTDTDTELTTEQRAAVHAAMSERFSLITGGPGTGKTSTIRAIVAEAARARDKVLLLAPTGRAATRMTEASGIKATTVHSALGWIPGEGPEHDEQDPLRCDLLILDESSMANLELLVALMRATPEDARVVLVGDADQLAPVGAGKPFAELVSCGRAPITRLTQIFRQAAGSMIVQGAHAIRAGRVPEFRPAPEMRRDLFLIEQADPLRARREIVELVTRRLPEHYGVDPVRDIQVFAPVYRGELGIDALNGDLREALNPDGQPVRGGRLRIGDKLMMTGRNLHELGLMNGTVLQLLDEIEGSAEHGEEAALLLSAEESVFRLPTAESERLRLAYACSVHRGQGIELPVAVIVAHPAAGAFFLRREMLYTAVTRARLATVIVGLRGTVAQAVRSTDTGRRRGRLAERLATPPGQDTNRVEG